IADAEKLALCLIEPVRRIDVDRQQPRQRQIDILDLLEIEPVMHGAQSCEFAGLQRHRRIFAQTRPLLPGKYPVRIVHLLRCTNIHDAASHLFASGAARTPGKRACAPPSLRVRRYRSVARARLRLPRASRRAISKAPADETTGVRFPRSNGRGPCRWRRSRSPPPPRRAFWRNAPTPCPGACGCKTPPR